MWAAPSTSMANIPRARSICFAGVLRRATSRWWHTPPLYNAENFLGNPLNVFGRILSFNMLCLPQETAQAPAGLQEIKSPPDASAFLRNLGAVGASP